MFDVKSIILATEDFAAKAPRMLAPHLSNANAAEVQKVANIIVTVGPKAADLAARLQAVAANAPAPAAGPTSTGAAIAKTLTDAAIDAFLPGAEGAIAKVLANEIEDWASEMVAEFVTPAATVENLQATSETFDDNGKPDAASASAVTQDTVSDAAAQTQNSADETETESTIDDDADEASQSVTTAAQTPAPAAPSRILVGLRRQP